jgi:hypothetical protein
VFELVKQERNWPSAADMGSSFVGENLSACMPVLLEPALLIACGASFGKVASDNQAIRI